jgi:hypothetical protein
MAVPTHFEPMELELGAGETGVFVDGRYGMTGDSALHLLLVATLRRHPFRWESGAERLLLVSVGSGLDPEPESGREAREFNLVDTLLRNGRRHSRRLLQTLSRSLFDPESPQSSSPAAIFSPGAPRLTYLRYDAPLDSAGLSQLGLSELAARPSVAFDDPKQLDALQSIGAAAARRQVNVWHFPSAFDPRGHESGKG